MLSVLKGVGGGNINHQKQTTTKNKKQKLQKKGHMVQIHSENRCVFRDLQNAAKGSASLIVCGRAFQSLGAELEKAWKPNYFFSFFFQQHLESVGVAAMMSEGVMQEHIGEWVPASILVLYLCSICTLGTRFCDQFTVSLATNAVLSRQD